MLTLTDDARLAIQALLAPDEAPADAGIRIAAATADSNGAAPELELVVVTEPAPGDQVVDDEGARVYLDETAARLLDHETLDVQIDQDARQVNFFVS
jgi:Fe-S cluster assembly iron-binding protein IscA